MSLILEALKKSEAERQRGQAPGLFVEQSPLARTRRAGTPAWAWALGGLLLVVLLLFGWREWSRMQATPSPQPSPASGRGSEEAAVPTLPPGREAAAVPTLPSGGEAAAVLPLPPGEGRGEGARTSEPMPARATRPEPSRLPSPQPAPASGSGGEPPAVVAAPTAGPALPRLADLDPGERAALPALKLTMHVFADDPAARFVILDGRRLGEGAMVAEGLVLREIRRDGVVLATPARELLLPRP